MEQICLKGGLSNPPKMNLLPIGCVLLLLASAQAEDIMFFADDHYKSLGRPALAASSANPALLAGEGVLHINLANLGRLEELMPINQSGPAQDILLEMKEEMKGSHALAIDAALIGSGPILVTSGPERIDDIAPGEKAMLDYNVSVMKNASGWSKLALDVSYQRQADVSVNNGEVYPLYEAARDNLSVDVFVAGKGESLRILGSALSHNLFRGQRLRAAISNDGSEDLHNCSARLLAAPPFSASGPEEGPGGSACRFPGPGRLRPEDRWRCKAAGLSDGLPDLLPAEMHQPAPDNIPAAWPAGWLDAAGSGCPGPGRPDGINTQKDRSS